MLVSLKWLQQFVELSGLSPEELAHRITMSGLEVSGIHDQRQGLAKVVVGRLLDVKPHPNADKLQLTEVEIPGERLRIVCGAKNIQVNDLVPVALEGAVLPGGLAIKKTKIRGQESQGMLCSEKELGIADEAAGIMHFPGDTPIGTEVAGLLDQDDVIFEIEVTPNRSDCLSHMGLARHLAAVLGRPFILPDINLKEDSQPASSQIQVDIEPGSGCRRYCCRVIQDVTIAPSPAWLRQQLQKVGQRSVNNVVDATNVVLLGLGHPLHAFDQALLKDARIIARKSRAQEIITTLDGVRHELTGEELVIADGQGPVALAGVMGGMGSEVNEQTKTIVLEAAWFDPKQVRQTVKITNTTSDSSYRFERGVDPEAGLRLALDLCAQMIKELAGGTILQGVVDYYPQPYEPRSIVFRPEKATRLLGVEVEPQNLQAMFNRLGYVLVSQGVQDIYQVPPFRHDVSLEQDMIEDIAQLIGYDQLPVKPPLVAMVAPVQDPKQTLVKRCRTICMEEGFNEIITYSFIDPRYQDLLRLSSDHPWRKVVKLRNPLSEALSTMRPSVMPGLLETLTYNVRRGQDRIKLFESGAVFIPTTENQLPEEPAHLGLMISGPKEPLYWQTGKKQKEMDFYELKGTVEALFQQLALPGPRFVPEEYPFLHPLVCFEIQTADKKPLGWIGALHPEIQDQLKLRGLVVAAELNLEILAERWPSQRKIKSYPRFPAIKRDIAIAVPEDTLAGEVVKKIKKNGTGLLTSVIPFDQYKSDALASGTKSLAFSLTFQDANRTLKEEEINDIQASIIEKLQKDFSAQLR